MRNPSSGDVRVTSDGLAHSVEVFSSEGKWQNIGCVKSVLIFVNYDNVVTCKVEIEAAFVDMIMPKDKLLLDLTGLEIPK